MEGDNGQGKQDSREEMCFENSCTLPEDTETHDLQSGPRERATFVEETLDNSNYEVWLEKEDIANIARIKYGFYGENCMFEVIGSAEHLGVQLDKFKNKLMEDNRLSLTFIVNISNSHWVTLVITYRGQQFVAYYIDCFGNEVPNNIHSMLKEQIKDINIQCFSIKQQNDEYNCGIFALENARVITEALQKPCVPQNEDFLKRQLTDDLLIEKRKLFARALLKREKIENKFEVLLKFLKSLNKGSPTEVNFNYENANVFLLFLETLAMEDAVLQDLSREVPKSKLRDYQQELVEQGIISLEDLKSAKYIRSDVILHRKVFSILEPSDFENIVKFNVRFFNNLEKYVQQVHTKLKGGNLDQSNLCQPIVELSQLLKSADEIQQFGKIVKPDHLREKIADFFKNAITKDCYADKRLNLEKANETMFKLVVNIVPFVDKRCRKAAGPIEKINWFTGDMLHKFYEFGPNYKLMNIALKHFMRSYKRYFFMYCYSLELCKILNETEPSDNVEIISNRLEGSLENFRNKFGKEYLAAEEDVGSFELVPSELVYSQIDNKDKVVSSCVHQYYKLFSIIDNEEAINDREKKHKENALARYEKLSGNDRSEIYEDFNVLKALFETKENKLPHSETTYDKSKSLLLKMFRETYGILTDNFNTMVKLFVESDDDLSFDGESDVTQGVLALFRIKEDHPYLSNQDIISKFQERAGKKDSKLEDKFHSIPKGRIIELSFPKAGKTKTVYIKTDRFTQNIIEMFFNSDTLHSLVFNNVQGAFNDELFLDYLENENVNVDNGLINKLLEIDYTAPYAARLMVKDELINKGIITDKQFEKTIETLLKEDSYIKHFKELLKRMSNEKSKKIDDKKLKKILKSVDENSIKQAFYGLVCDKMKNIENMRLIFEEPEYTKGILSVLRENMKSGTDQSTKWIKAILKLLNTIANEMYYKGCEEDLAVALILLDGAHKLRKELTKNKLMQENDLITLEAERITARIRNKEGRLENYIKNAKGFYEKAYKILDGMKDSIAKSLPCNPHLLPMFLLNLSDLSYTLHLLNKCSEAYKTYETLYKEMIKHILHLPGDELSQYTWSKEDYVRIIRSETYNEILLLSPKYLNILKIKSDMANELICLASAKQAEFDEVSQNYQSALNIYEEIYKVYETDATFGQYTLKTMRDIAFVNNMLAKLKTENTEMIHEALNHYNNAYKMYKLVLQIQENESLWEAPTANSKSKQDILQTQRNIANTHHSVGDMLKSQHNPEDALKHYKEALNIYKEIYEGRKSILGEKHEQTLNTRRDIAYTNNSVGDLLKSQKHPEEALKHYKEALNIYKEVYDVQKSILGDKHEHTLNTRRDIAYTHTNLGNMLKSQHNHEGALKHYKEALNKYKEVYEVEKSILDDKHEHNINIRRYIAQTHKSVGDLLKSQHNSEDALKHYKEALNIYKEIYEGQKSILGEKHEHTLNTRRDIAYTHYSVGDMLKSQNNPEEALKIYKEALNIHKEVYEGQKSILGEKHEHTLNTRMFLAYRHNSVGDMLKSQYNPEEALKHYKEALYINKEVYEVEKSILDDKHEHNINTRRYIAQTHKSVGDLLKSQHNPEDALKHYKEALNIYKEVYEVEKSILDDNHEHTLNTRRAIAYRHKSVGDLLKSQNNPKEALKHYKEALSIYKEVYEVQKSILDAKHEHNINIRRYIAQTHKSVGDLLKPQHNPEVALKHYKEALNIYKEIYEVEQSILDDKHEHTLNTRMDIAQTHKSIGDLLKSQHNPEDAIKHYKVALNIYEQVYQVQESNLGEKHVHTLNTRRYIAYTNNNLDRLLKSQRINQKTH